MERNAVAVQHCCLHLWGKWSLVSHNEASTSGVHHHILVSRWYGVGGTIQLAIFGMVAAKVKMNANGAHTFLEVWGPSMCALACCTV